MQIITDLNFQLNHSAVCIGKFDGIHRGHRLLLREAKKTGLTTVMLTFIFPNAETIYSYEEKLYLAEQLDVDVFVAISVTEEFIHMSAEDFVKEILVERCQAKKIVVGSDFGFGYQRSGNVEFLQSREIVYGYDVTVFEKMKARGEVISSTRIRKLLAEGNMEEANELLETPFFVQSKVQNGNQIGRTISVPTANLVPAKGKVLPPFGVYAVLVKADGKIYKGVGNLGVKPTIPGNNPIGLEVWLFDFQGDLYGKTLQVAFISFVRTERKFANIQELQNQIAQDSLQAKEKFASEKNINKFL